MSLSAALFLAAAAPSVQGEPVSHGPVRAEARVMATILPAVIVRQDRGVEQASANAPRHQLSRRGNTVLVEFQ